MKIIICSNIYPPNFIGGAELIAHFQALELKKKGHEVVIFAGETGGNNKRYFLGKDVYDGLEVNRVYLTPMDYQSEYLNFYHKEVEEHFINLLDNFKPDLVHSHNLVGLSLGIIHLAKKRGIKTFVTLHDKWGFCLKNTALKDNSICDDYNRCFECISFNNNGINKRTLIQMRKDYFSLMFSDVDCFISPSRYLAQTYIDAGLPENKMNVLWNGVDNNRFEKIQNSKIYNQKIRFSFVGHFGKHKGLHLLLDAVSQLPDKKNIMVNLAGEGEEQENYNRQIEENQIEKQVKFWGKVDNSQIEKVYRETDVLVLPSIWPENQPVSITEAMACRIPVITTRLGGSIELVDDKKSGFLFDYNSAADLSRKMSEFILDPSKIKQFGEAGYQKIIHNTFENQITKLLEIYNNKKVPEETHENSNQLIVCIGERVDSRCAMAMEGFLKTHKNYYFIMKNWLEDDLLEKAKLFWIVDKNITLKELTAIFKFDRPILVPAQNLPLTSFCRNENCGLYYADSSEAEVCLEFLLANEQKANTMGDNIANSTQKFI